MWETVLSVFIIAVDQLSKRYVQRTVPPNGSIDLPGRFASITNVENSGAAFGLFQGAGAVSVLVTLLIIALVLWQRHKIRREGTAARLGVVLLVSGAIGNLIDRVTTGRVIDFIDIQFWPVFNIADIAIVSGVGILMLKVLLSKPEIPPDEVEDR